LEPYSRHIVRFGDTGAGMAAKLVRNVMQYSYWVMIHEGMALAERAGLDLAAFGELFAESIPSTHTMISAKPTMAPMAIDDADAERVAFLENVTHLGWKDLDAAAELAREVDLEMPLATVVRRRYGPAIGIALEPPVDQAPGVTH
jgi:3-hydroxyisobutyrate dehydrogenase-like beta-hydroxyacid dehydrogenase